MCVCARESVCLRVCMCVCVCVCVCWVYVGLRLFSMINHLFSGVFETETARENAKYVDRESSSARRRESVAVWVVGVGMGGCG